MNHKRLASYRTLRGAGNDPRRVDVEITQHWNSACLVGLDGDGYSWEVRRGGPVIAASAEVGLYPFYISALRAGLKIAHALIGAEEQATQGE